MGQAYALIPAAGRGERFRPPDTGETPAASVDKLLIPLAGLPVLAHTLLAFERCPVIQGIVLVSPLDRQPQYDALARDSGVTKPIHHIDGGSTRQESVLLGLEALPASAEIVAIHDAARPLVSPELIARTVEAARKSGAAVACTPVTDTVKRVHDGAIRETISRDLLRAAQTPQAFRVPLIVKAHAEARDVGFSATDDSTLVERLGQGVTEVVGERSNLKITTGDDVAWAEAWLTRTESGPGPGAPGRASPRIGHGYDVHRLVTGRPLFLAGVEIAHTEGLEGHSDADAPLHALMDALLGAAGLPDIGHWFPNTDLRWRGASSRTMLRDVVGRLNDLGLNAVNVDVTIIAERPKVAPYLDRMRAAIADDLGLSPGSVGIKATTHEGIGALGRGDGIAAHAVVLLAAR